MIQGKGYQRRWGEKRRTHADEKLGKTGKKGEVRHIEKIQARVKLVLDSAISGGHWQEGGKKRMMKEGARELRKTRKEWVEFHRQRNR